MSGSDSALRVTIDAALKQRCPALRLAVVSGSVRVTKSSNALVAELNARAAEIAKLPEAASHPEILATREAYKKLGKEPSRYRGSSEALVRRIVAGKGLYFINNLVDINNLVSLEGFLPIGSYDLAKIDDSFVFRIGGAGEAYKGIGKDLINIADLPAFADLNGPFGSPTSDSERAMITEDTTRFAMVLIAFSGGTQLEEQAARAKELVAAHAGGEGLQTTIVE
jgi:DNA/RNA-binding domain of Phe-tRNA-synthetase-like protein